MAHTPEQIRISHLIDDTEKMRGTVRRNATESDRIMDDLRHAIENGRTTAALDLLITIERHNTAILDAVKSAR